MLQLNVTYGLNTEELLSLFAPTFEITVRIIFPFKELCAIGY